jgi:hypothetical protein
MALMGRSLLVIAIGLLLGGLIVWTVLSSMPDPAPSQPTVPRPAQMAQPAR